MYLLFAVALVAVNGFFVAAEFGIVKLRPTRVLELAAEGGLAAKTLEKIHQNVDSYLSACQLGITLASLALGWIGEPAIATLLEPAFDWAGIASAPMRHAASIGLGFAFISYAHIVIGEQAPKTWAIRREEQVGLFCAIPLYAFHFVMYPAILLLNKSSLAIVRRAGLDVCGRSMEHEASAMSENELKMVIGASERQGEIETSAADMIKGAFDLGSLTVREAMAPRSTMTALVESSTVMDALRLFREVTHSRFPVYSGHLDNIVGIVSMKEIILKIAEAAEEGRLDEALREPISSHVRKVIIAPDGTKLASLLRDFKSKREQMAIVIDEYGGTEGLITLEDIVEEVVGDYDDELSRQSKMFRQTSDGRWEIDAAMRSSLFESRFGVCLPQGDYITLGGFAYEFMGRVPLPGETFELPDNGIFEVSEMDNHRIVQLRFTKTNSVKGTQTGEPDADKNVSGNE